LESNWILENITCPIPSHMINGLGVGKGRLMVFKFSATFNNISVNIMVVSFLVEETGVLGENN
jgi:hypothetical protein